MGTIAELLGMPIPEDSPLYQSVDSDGADTKNSGETSSEDKIRGVVYAAVSEETGRNTEVMTDDYSLNVDLDLDELGLFSVITSIERALSITLPDKDVRALNTVADLYACVLSEISGGKARGN